MELASAAIDWIWEAIESIVERAIEPIDQFAQSWMDSVLKMMWLINFTSENPPSEERINNFSSILITPIFYTIFAVVIIFFMAINIISYFIPWIAWLLSAVYVLIISILTVYFLNEATTDEDLSVFDNAFLSSKSMTQDPMDYFLSFLKRDDDDGTRDNVENTTVKWLLCIGAVIYGLSGFIAAFLKDFYKLYLGGGWMVVSLFIQGCYYLIPSSHNIIRATFFFIEGFMFFISTFLNLKTWIEDKSLPIKFISAVSTGFSLISSAVNFALAARCLNQ